MQRPKLRPRDYISVSRIDHKSSKAVSKGMDLSTLFSDAGACMLMPAVDQGPLCKSPRQKYGVGGRKLTGPQTFRARRSGRTLPMARRASP